MSEISLGSGTVNPFYLRFQGTKGMKDCNSVSDLQCKFIGISVFYKFVQTLLVYLMTTGAGIKIFLSVQVRSGTVITEGIGKLSR